MPLRATSSPYGRTKQMGEAIVEDACKADLQGVSLRYFNPIGSEESATIGEWPIGQPANIVPALTQALEKDEVFLIHGNDYHTTDGTCIRDYLHVMDLAEVHIAALEWLKAQSGSCYEVFNCGRGKGSSVLEIVETFEAQNSQKVRYRFGPRRAGDLAETYASVDKAERILKWRAAYSLESALQSAWRWQQNIRNISKELV